MTGSDTMYQKKIFGKIASSIAVFAAFMIIPIFVPTFMRFLYMTGFLTFFGTVILYKKGNGYNIFMFSLIVGLTIAASAQFLLNADADAGNLNEWTFVFVFAAVLVLFRFVLPRLRNDARPTGMPKIPARKNRVTVFSP